MFIVTEYAALKMLLKRSCLAERNHLGRFGRRHYGEHFCEIILNLDQWFRICITQSSGGGVELLSNFGRGHYDGHFCEIMNLHQLFRGSCLFKILSKSSGGYFVQQIGTI